MQVYVLINALAEDRKSIYLLVVKKRDKGYFFEGKLIPDGAKLNGAGLYALPGGLRDASDSGQGLVAAGIREFREETGVDLEKSADQFFAEKYGKVRAFLTLEVSDHAELERMRAEIAENLGQAASAVEKVKNRTITSWSALVATYPKCPSTNELASVEIWNSSDQAELIKSWKQDKQTDWFYGFFCQQYKQFAPE
ncbi:MULTISPECIES: hypothetical protein [unclassified Solwaraspora]|uniref:hypothetical protein n=1 Tax=unclassified Solwaraspora TaxID=2627926 RepID=UPI00259BB5DC|nr:hypothetical protein [Solwaraspora sp. WMMA2056]WJK38176.1 hypothetical protein O7608_16800 [Solwaraspora sp. WMMA2056]